MCGLIDWLVSFIDDSSRGVKALMAVAVLAAFINGLLEVILWVIRRVLI